MNKLGKGAVAAIFVGFATYAYAGDISDVPRAGLITVGNKDLYMPIPWGYPMESAGQRSGPDKLWYKAFWLPTGETLSNWSEMTSILMLPGNAEPLDVMGAQMSKQCPQSFFRNPAEAPQLFNMQGTVSASTMGCINPADHSKLVGGGYFVSVRTAEYSYLLSIEFRGDRVDAKERLSNTSLSGTMKTFSRFTVCAKNEMCFKSGAK